jgi:DNA-binding NtrC family response regulator
MTDRNRRENGGAVMTLGTSILIVDDDTEVRKTLSSILDKEGYLVETVENGKQAIRACEKSLFDVALIDIELPDMKGTALLNRLKQEQPRMVKIIITGFPSLENAMKAVNEGANGYVLKPFDVQELLEMIRKHLDEKKAEYLRTWTEKSESEQERNKFSKQFKKSDSLFSQ